MGGSDSDSTVLARLFHDDRRCSCGSLDDWLSADSSEDALSSEGDGVGSRLHYHFARLTGFGFALTGSSLSLRSSSTFLLL